MKFNVQSLLSDKQVGYAIVVLAVLNVLGYLTIQRMDLVLLFVVIAAVVFVFQKNLAIVALIPLLLTNVVALMPGRLFEGMTSELPPKPPTPAQELVKKVVKGDDLPVVTPLHEDNAGAHADANPPSQSGFTTKKRELSTSSDLEEAYRNLSPMSL